METTGISKENNNIVISKPQLDGDHQVPWEEEFQELVQTLHKSKEWNGNDLYFYQGFWCPSLALKAVISFQKHFQPLDSDIIVTSVPKCGTTWLKALTFSIVNRNKFAKEDNPLLRLVPHRLVPFFEFDIYLNNSFPDLENGCSYNQPRLFSTHIPFASLPPFIKESKAKIVYICRNPMDMFISFWFYVDKLGAKNAEPLSLDEAFDMFCKGIHGFGPFFDHVLGYWKASQENPNKILFLQYEDLQEDIISHLKKLAMFLGFPFSEEEEKHGVVEEIAKTCSFGSLKELDVNKNGVSTFGIPHSAFFRKAEVGDWRNYLTPAMVERMKKLMQDNLDHSGDKWLTVLAWGISMAITGGADGAQTAISGYHAGPMFNTLVERVIYGEGILPEQVEEAKLILKDHEKSILSAIAKLHDVSDDDDSFDLMLYRYSHRDVHENKRQIVTHCDYHLQAGRSSSYPPKKYPLKKRYPL
ncbi:hypothetical protein PTKIN_Ptkin01aG0380200 [Pterospermum kingtungense]